MPPLEGKARAFMCHIKDCNIFIIRVSYLLLTCTIKLKTTFYPMSLRTIGSKTIKLYVITVVEFWEDVSLKWKIP